MNNGPELSKTFRKFLDRWRWIKWKLFLIWAVLIAIALIRVVLPVVMSSGPTP